MLPAPNHKIQTRIVEFLRGIGIAVREEAIVGDSFLPGVTIEKGELIFDRARNTWPGDLLHEAGHLAVLPFTLRTTVGGNLPDTVLAAHAGEAEATAWAYAALREIGLPAEVLFHEGGYGGNSAGLLFTYGAGVYPGAAGLSATGMAAAPAEARSGRAKAYPAMLRWLRA
jgi:hypothetical protein